MVGWSLGCQPQASGRVEPKEAGQDRAGAETQWLFWELAEAGVEEQDLSTLGPQGAVKYAAAEAGEGVGGSGVCGLRAGP